MSVTMPDDIAEDPIQKEVWEQICPEGNAFEPKDIPNLRAYCYLQRICMQAQKNMRRTKGNVGITKKTKRGVVKNPDFAVYKEASAEARMYAEILGLSRKAQPTVEASDDEESVPKAAKESRRETLAAVESLADHSRRRSTG